MASQSITALSPYSISLPHARRYLIALSLVYLAVVVYLLIDKSPKYWGMALGLPIAVAIITQPRLAVYQFLFCLFLDIRLIESPAIYLCDISAGLLVMAGLFDYLLGDRQRSDRPPMVLNYVFLVVALFVSAVFGYSAPAAVFPIARILFLCAAFLSLVRLSNRAPYADAFRVFFVLIVIHSIIALGPAIASGGRVRSFGLAGTVYDDTAMLAVPCGLAMYLWTASSARRWYLVGTLIVLAGLIGTQTRFTILVGLLLCIGVIIVSLARARSLRHTATDIDTDGVDVGRRVVFLFASVALMASLFLLLVPSILERALARFDAAASATAGGTMLLRMTLWKAALKVFVDHPLTGIGPGLFRTVDQYYGSLMFGPTHVFVKGLSAHNLLLHYLAESGLIGGAALLAYVGNQFRLARGVWRQTAGAAQTPLRAGLVVVSFGILLTTFAEGGWMWGATGFVAVFFIAAVVSEHRITTVS
jgi:O-antigen ligase